jgi:hypothetical protein
MTAFGPLFGVLVGVPAADRNKAAQKPRWRPMEARKASRTRRPAETRIRRASYAPSDGVAGEGPLTMRLDPALDRLALEMVWARRAFAKPLRVLACPGRGDPARLAPVLAMLDCFRTRLDEHEPKSRVPIDRPIRLNGWLHASPCRASAPSPLDSCRPGRGR